MLGNSILESFHLLLRGLWGGNAPLDLTLHALLQHDDVLWANQKIRNLDNPEGGTCGASLQTTEGFFFFFFVRTIIPLCNITAWCVAYTLINQGPKRGFSQESHRRTILGSWENLYTSLHKEKKIFFRNSSLKVEMQWAKGVETLWIRPLNKGNWKQNRFLMLTHVCYVSHIYVLIIWNDSTFLSERTLHVHAVMARGDLLKINWTIEVHYISPAVADNE